MTVMERLVEVMRDYTEEEIVEGARLEEDLCLDSLDVVEVSLAVEEEFDCEFEDEEVEEWKTVGDILKSVEGRK